jgi:DNA-binding MarR family transcriptional regulator
VKRISLSGTGLCVAFQLRRTSRAITQLYDAALEPSGIRSTQFALLVAIAKKEPISISDLGDLLVIDPTTLSRSLPKLERMGHIRFVHGSDHRERLVRLTAKGRSVLEKSLPCWRRVQAEVVSNLAQPSWHEIQKSLERIKRVSQEVLKKGAVRGG